MASVALTQTDFPIVKTHLQYQLRISFNNVNLFFPADIPRKNFSKSEILI